MPPIYDYACPNCNWYGELQIRMDERHSAYCKYCGSLMRLQVSAVYGRIAGQVVEGGGADRFTADALGIPLKELPAGLKQDFKG